MEAKVAKEAATEAANASKAKARATLWTAVVP